MPHALPPPPIRMSYARTRKPDELIYVASNGIIDVYDATVKNQFPIAQIQPPSGAGSLWVDASEDLYVSAGLTIYAYHRGALKPFRTLLHPNVGAVAVCGDNAGHIFTTDAGIGQAPGDTIEVYGRGSRPEQTLYEYNALEMGACAADSHGDLFVSYQSNSFPYDNAIDEFAAGNTTPVTLMTGFQATNFSATFAFDAQANIALPMLEGTPPNAQWVVNVFAPPYTGAPLRTIAFYTAQLAFDETGKYLWAGTNAADELVYATGKTRWYTAEIAPDAMAVSPPLPLP